VPSIYMLVARSHAQDATEPESEKQPDPLRATA
jgi:hypothetical protein